MSDAYDSDGDGVPDSSQAGVPRAPLDVARDKMHDADAAMMRASNSEDLAAAGGIAGVAVATGGGAAVGGPAAPLTATVAGTAAALGAVANYAGKVDSTEAAIDTATEARKAFNDEALKAGLPTVNTADTAYEARPWHTDAGRAFEEKVGPVVEEVSKGANDAYDLLSTGASDAYTAVSETASEAYTSVSETASEAYDAVADYFGGGEEQQQ